MNRPNSAPLNFTDRARNAAKRHLIYSLKGGDLLDKNGFLSLALVWDIADCGKRLENSFIMLSKLVGEPKARRTLDDFIMLLRSRLDELSEKKP